jgi:integrase
MARTLGAALAGVPEENLNFLNQLSSAAVAAQHATSTRTGYDYWLGRFERFCVNPSERLVMAGEAGIPLAVVFSPKNANERLSQETFIFGFIAELTLGPQDEALQEVWKTNIGPIDPATITAVLAALKHGSKQWDAWVPSETFQAAMKGLKRGLREAEDYEARGPAQAIAAKPLALMAAELEAVPGKAAARDRLVCELLAAGVSVAGIGRLTWGDVMDPPAGVTASSPAANAALHKKTGLVGLRSLVVPGQVRKGNNQDPALCVALVAWPELASALAHHQRYNERPQPGAALISTGQNRADVLRKIVLRLTRTAAPNWEPSTPLTRAELAVMRAELTGTKSLNGRRRRRDRAMLLTEWWGAMRRSELTALRIKDVAFETRGAKVKVRKSKTSSKEVVIGIPAGDGTGAGIESPSVVLEAWVNELLAAGATPDTPLFPAITRTGSLGKGGISNARPVGDQVWSDRVRELAGLTGYFTEQQLARCTSHGLRRGFITEAASRGVDTMTIAKHSRHKDPSMVAHYTDAELLLEQTDWSALFFGTETAAS